MNDNLRYISLQYIKGTNYEEIRCFKYDVIKEILEDEGNFREVSIDTLRDLEDAIDDDNICYIGESFLNDLVNYYNFKDIKSKIKKAKAIIEDNKKTIKKDASDENKAQKKKKRLDIIIALKELVDVLERLKTNSNIGEQLLKGIDIKEREGMRDKGTKKIREEEVAEAIAEAAVKKYKKVKVLLEIYDNKMQLDGINDINKSVFRNNLDDMMKYITQQITYAIDTNTGDDYSAIKKFIVDGIKQILNNNAGTKYNLISLLLTLRKLILYENEQDSLKGKVELDNADNLLVLLKTYTKICDRNIGKFDRLFKQNDIVDIDEAFMIESYATFLNKLNKLKRNLESKDKGKLERALTKSLDKLFNLYGINDYEKLINTDSTANNDAQNYIKKLIDDY
jgi:hypothetical protein|uniref:Uncharacterized protein n=1 Tax=viral metagenome TaxID=1070528 RepID=A0A6C0CD92_9ZZZZ